ncbi:DUF881 domain-containing protein [Aeromicrobium sp. 636]|uniref:DUF881 domain-containing protein n=1 Tax=Aeromicrobium senzhongii TaxID=2663859 RepID=A0A8I0JYN9_9ACTN|nr:DUF881 domain-containing protein [Aeromicrobium sp. 636]MBC9225082.1 DUF881 domain-containing protein [Aeromicrobium senzhongii]MCQ3997192.1 DUF881 domain-containing protein [Aeromicrobium sp. 636]
MSRQSVSGSSVEEAESILERLAATALDDDYYVAHDTPPRPVAKVLTAVMAGVFGLLVTVAAVQTRIDRPATEAERNALIENIRVREDLVKSKQETVVGLQQQIADLQAESVVDGPGTAGLRVAAGSVAVEGPGVVLTVESSANEDRPGGRLTDTDLQLVVNGLWLAGAEAVSVGGHRLTATSAIRSAGEAITVNYRSVTEPIVVEAIGDEDVLRSRWEEGPSGRYLAARAEADGIWYDVQGSDDVELDAAPEARLSVSAEPLRRSES